MYRPGSFRTAVRRKLADGVRALHGQRLFTRHGLPSQVAQRELHGLGLGVDSVPIHDSPEVHVVELDVRPYSRHTPTIHAACMISVSRPGVPDAASRVAS